MQMTNKWTKNKQLHHMMLGFYRAIFAANKAKISYMRHSLNAKSDD